jgi:Fe-S cluster assembly scaffold protein SufB
LTETSQRSAPSAPDTALERPNRPNADRPNRDRPARERPARRSPDDLGFRLDEALVERWAGDEPDWSARARRAALDRYRSLPPESNRLYTPYIDLRAARLDDVRLYAEPAAAPADTTSAPPSGTAGLASFVEDAVAAVTLTREAAAAGVTIDPIGRLIGRDPDTARGLLGDAEATGLPLDDRFAQLTLAAWNQGLVIRVPAGVRLAEPLVVRWSVGAAGHALLARTVVELGEGAEVSIVEEMLPSPDATPSAGGGQALLALTTEATLAGGAHLAYASLQEAGPEQVVLAHRTARVGEAASMSWALAQLGARLVRGRVDNHLTGDRSTVDQAEIVFATEEQLVDLTTYTRHVGRDTTGNVLSKGVLRDRARMFLKGMAIIDRSAVGTDSFLGEYGMNLSKATRSVAIPSLEIDQPDCRRAAHSSSVGPIDETQVFYLASRGIPDDEARKFIVLGYLEPVVARVPHADAQDRLRAALDAKWAGGAAAEAA